MPQMRRNGVKLDPITKRFISVDPEREQKQAREYKQLQVQAKGRKRSAKMVGMKEQGYTLQEIGSVYEITRERVRQRIDEYCEKIGLMKPDKRGSIQERLGLLSTTEAAKRIGCSYQRLTYYRKQGLVNAKCIKGQWFYNEVETVKAGLVFQNEGRYYSVTLDEIKEKAHLGGIARGQDPEYREKMHLAAIARWQDPELREKMRLNMVTRWQDPEFSNKMREVRQIKPNKAEIYLQGILDKYYPGTYKYVGDFQVNIGGRFPDFINVNGKKEVIELFGNYWHNPNEFPNKPSQRKLISHYKQYGYTCVVIWEEEFRKTKVLLKHIKHGGIYVPKLSGFIVSDYEEYEEVEITLDPITKKFSQKIKIIKGQEGGITKWLKRVKRMGRGIGRQQNQLICQVRKWSKGFWRREVMRSLKQFIKF